VVASSNGLFSILSVGLGISSGDRLDAAHMRASLYDASFFVQTYAPSLVERFYLRPGIRFGYETTAEAEPPQAVHINERTYKSGVECALLYDWLMIPAISLQGNLLRRTLQLQTAAPIVQGLDAISSSEWLWETSLSFGLGLPIAQGAVVIEPFYRRRWIQRDSRQTSQWGLDVSAALPTLSSK